MKIDKNYHQKLTLLKLYYTSVLNLLDTLCGAYIVHLDPIINMVYLVLINKVESILKEKKFSELKKDYERPFENLLGIEAKEPDIYWKEGRIGEKAKDFYSKIDELFIKIEEGPIPIESLPDRSKIKNDLKMANEAIEIIKEWKEQDKKKMEKTMMNFKAQIKSLGIENNQKTEQRKTLITRDKETGDFYYKNKIIKFDNKEAIYYRLFECLYENGDLKGFCSYKDINKYLEKHGGKEYTENQQIADRIKNGLASLFRFANLPQKTPDGKDLIRKIRGKGLTLYNPSL
ncbi:hypothetical protein ACFL06_01540 [Patescibacteria group bacterium]